MFCPAYTSVVHKTQLIGGEASIIKSNASDWSNITLAPDIVPMYFKLKSARALAEFIVDIKGSDFSSSQNGLFNLYV